MARPKKGTKGSEEATQKWRKTMQQKYGGMDGVHNMMRIIGSKGGQNGHTGGFAANRDLARKAGKKAGRISKRGYKFIRQEEGFRVYLDKKTGKVVKFPV